MTPFSDSSSGRGPQRRGPGGPSRGFNRPGARGFGSGPAGRGPASRGPAGRSFVGQGRPERPDRPFRPRTSFRPDGSEKQFDQPRPPRPGRQEREAIRAGTRPFFKKRPGYGGGPAEGPRDEEAQAGSPAPRPFGRPPLERPRTRPFSRPPADGPRPARPAARRPVEGFEGDDDQPWGNAPAGPARPPRPVGRRPQAPRDFEPEAEVDETEGGPDEGAQLRTNLDFAVMIVEKATAKIPADLLLRQTLARRKRLTRDDSAWISRAVFSYYRWLNWLPPEAPLGERISGALELADRFAANPNEVSDKELLDRAIPAWVRNELSVTPAWVRALQAEPTLWIRVRRSALSQVEAVLPGAQSAGLARFPEAFRYAGDEDLFRHNLFQAGGFEIQDIGSQAVGIVCAPQATETWWDTCAGEGGKTLHLSDLMGGKGLIWATDRSEWRLNRLKLRAGRAACFNYRSRAWTGSEKLPTETKFDGILVDAPCSGLGTWGRNPHSRWTLTQQDIAELAAIQKKLLHHAAAALKPGGRLIYAACTLTRAETLDVATELTAQHPELEPLPLENPFQPGKVPSTTLTLWPQDTQGNGMFLAGWRKKA